MAIECENFLCIYEEDGECMFDEISLDISGTCQECVYPDFDEPGVLEKAKRDTLKKFEEYEKDRDD